MVLRLFAIVGFAIMLIILAGFLVIKIRVPALLEFSRGVGEVWIDAGTDSLPSLAFVEGFNGAENLAFVPGGDGFFVTCLDGQVHHVDRSADGSFSIVRSIRPGTVITGICALSDSMLAVVVSKNPREDWMSVGGSVWLMPFAMDTMYRITGDLPGANGICADRSGNLYVASSNFKLTRPRGDIFILRKIPDGTYAAPESLFGNIGLANGLFYDNSQNRIFFSNTIGGVYSFVPGERTFREEYLKLHFTEACDDLCTDIGGNIWMTDPGHSTVKVLNPGTDRLVRVMIAGAGQTSSCRIRHENGHEILYLTELKSENKVSKDVSDGRRVLIVPAKEMLKLARR